MSNRTIQGAKTVHGSDPQLLIEKITRERIYASLYWKEKCFGLTAETILDRALELTSVGGSFGAQQKPTEFLCLLLKLLQLQPSEEIVLTYLDAEDHKYLRVLAGLYYRFVFPSVKVYKTLEPLLADFRRIRIRQRDGTFALKRFDELIWVMLREEKWFDNVMPRLTKRQGLEDLGELECARRSIIESEYVQEEEEEKEGEEEKKKKEPVVYADEIEEENALRAKLGLKPLQR
jgi:pre-mRNA-splicing factor 38A